MLGLAMASTSMKRYYIFLLLFSVVLSVFTSQMAHMNNWLIFKASFDHLLDGTSLYQLYPSEHDDLFKYSPTFALFMAPLSWLPAWVGAVLWNLTGVLLFILALHKLPVSTSTRKGIFWISLAEFIGSTQGFQSNIHMVALLILFWVALENREPLRASLYLLLSFFIKIFGVLGLVLLLFKPYFTADKSFAGKILISLVGLAVALGLAPLLLIDLDSLIYQYQGWLALLRMDAAQSHGFSLMGFFHGVFGLEVNRLAVQVAGGLSLVGSLLYFRAGDQNQRLMGLVALCYFMVVFNHKSESPTFIIPMFAFGIHQALITNKRLRWSLIVFTLGCVSLMYSDLFRSIKQSHLDVYCVKIWPFLILYPMALLQWKIQRTAKHS